jgi:hypothetical protein
VAVEKQCLQNCLQKFLSNASMWKKAGQYYVLNISPVPPTEEMCLSIKACGTILALYLAWGHGIPKIINPFLIAFIFGGTNALLDLNFIHSIDPSAANDLDKWPKAQSDPIRLSPSSSGQAREINTIRYSLLAAIGIDQVSDYYWFLSGMMTSV